MADAQQGFQSNTPEVRFQYGGVSASVFRNEAKRADGTTFTVRRTVVQRVYRDANEEFQSTSSLGINDIPKAVVALQRAYEHCLTSRSGEPAADD